MEFQDIVKQTENTSEFNAWRATHPEDFLAHIFVMLDEANKGIYQIGYFSQKNDRVSTFIVGKGQVQVAPDQEVAHVPGTTIAPLDITQVKASTEDITEAATNVLKEHYEKAPILKSFFIIQHLGGHQVYNFTYLTQDFQTINIRLDMDLKLLSNDVNKLADFATQEE
ncbi:MAG: hypothetical protein ACE5FT_03530 [Candidatus Nanoarchaeia archaeon]